MADHHRGEGQHDHRHRLARLAVGGDQPVHVAAGDVHRQAGRHGLEDRRREHRHRRAQRERERVVAELRQRQRARQDQLVALRHERRAQVGDEHRAGKPPDAAQWREQRPRLACDQAGRNPAVQPHHQPAKLERRDRQLPQEELHHPGAAPDQQPHRAGGAQRRRQHREARKPHLALQTLDRAAVDLRGPAQHQVQAQQLQRGLHHWVRQAGGLEPVLRQERRSGPDRHRNQAADGAVQPLHRAQQAVQFVGPGAAGREARHLQVQRVRQAQVDHRDPGLQRHEQTDQPVRLEPQAADVQRHQRKGHQHDERLADEVGGNVELQGHECGGMGG